MHEINHTFDLVGYVSGLVTLRKSGAYFIGACPICGGRDRFNVKSAKPDLWICRKCSGDKYHDAIAFMMAYHNVNFKDAVRIMGGELKPSTPQRPTPQPPVLVQVIPSQDWQAEAWEQIDAASEKLLNDDSGEPGRRYLAARGISQASMSMHLLGYGMVHSRLAIFIPWLDVGDVVTAVKYRFIDGFAQDKSKRFAMMAGSKPSLFGFQFTSPDDHTLLFVEGELNAISIFQMHPRGVSVVSAGSEGNGNEALLRTLAKNYTHVVIWMDDPAHAFKVRDRMQRPDAKLLRSPVTVSVKWDANRMLIAGLLNEFLTRELSVECEPTKGGDSL